MSSSGEKGCLVTIFTVVGAITSTRSTTGLNSPSDGALFVSSRMCSIENLTAAASNASPLENLTFGRSSNCHVFSSVFFHAVASSGLSERSTNPSWTCCVVLNDTPLRTVLGSNVSMSTELMITSLLVAAAGLAAAVDAAAADDAGAGLAGALAPAADG